MAVQDGYRLPDDDHSYGFSGLVGPFWHQAEPCDGKTFRVALTVEQRHLNLQDICHGGVLMAFADELLGATADAILKPAPFVTVNMHTQFQSPARKGDLLEGIGVLIHHTRNLMFLDGRIQIGDRLIATAGGLFRRPSNSPPST